MKSRWSDSAAKAAVEAYRSKGIGEDLALRTYSARLLGSDPKLVLHGGGNTSVKTRMRDVYGEEVDVLCVKGSGWDLATIEPPGHPAVRLAPLHRLRALDALSDEDMVSVQRANLLDSDAPNPSVETLLHAYIGHKFVDHTHSVAAIAIADQPDAEALCQKIYGARVACVPYIPPGFALAKAAGDVFDAHPGIEGLLLVKHGIFSFGATAREAYERMIDLVSLAEDYIAQNSRKSLIGAALPAPLARKADILPILRGALARDNDERRWVLDCRDTSRALSVVNAQNLSELARRGVATPDHVIRTKPHVLALPAPLATDLTGWAEQVEVAIAGFREDYKAYFERNNARLGGIKTMLDTTPRVLAVPGIGLIGAGKDGADAGVIADVALAWVESLIDAESIGRLESISEAETFDMEYWSLEQAKLGKGGEKRLARQIVAVTGGAGAIGAATAKAFAQEGACVAVLDLDGDAARAVAAQCGKAAIGLACDVTDSAAVAIAFDAIAERFGGLDILVSNAGAAYTGMIATLPDTVLRKSFELNFFSHQTVAQAAVKIMKAQGTGGALLFNVSKQAINPGPDFGAYGTAKAALLALVRQYALEHGADGIRANALNPDRIRSGLLTDAMIETRARSRGLSTADYMGGNLLKREVTAQDVAQAFIVHALMRKTTGDVLTVDGGNVAAMLR